MRPRIYPKQVGRQVALLELAQFRGLDVAVRVLDHGRLVVANALFPRRFQRPAECACTVVSEGGIQASQSDEIRAPEWGDIEKAKVKAPRVGGRPAMRQVFKSISWRRPTRRDHEEVSAPNIS
jgi:hypothetical protein